MAGIPRSEAIPSRLGEDDSAGVIIGANEASVVEVVRPRDRLGAKATEHLVKEFAAAAELNRYVYTGRRTEAATYSQYY